MGQGSSQPAGLAQSGESDDDSGAQAAAQKYSSPQNSVKISKAKSQQGSSKRRRKSSQSGTGPSAVSPDSLSTSVEGPGPSSQQEAESAAVNRRRNPSESAGTSHPAPPLSLKKSQRENKITSKRKRNSFESGSSLLRTSPDDQPSAVKRKRLVDSLSNNDASAPDRKDKTRSDHRTNDSQSRASSVRLPRSAPSEIIKSDYKMSPSPALSTGGSQAKGRLNRSNGTINAKGTTGAFLPHEVEALEDFKVEFCNANACSTTVFDLMVQHGKEGPFPGPNGIGKRTFWQQIHKILPGRDRRSVYRFMKRHFQASGQKPHEWTEEQEDELVVLYQQHGPKWAHIAEMLGRSGDDVVQRWKNRLEHRDTMKTGPWSNEETSQLKNALRSAWEKLRSEGIDVGENIYEMDESLISWSQISKSMRHIRSRQQCADKWRRLKLTAAGPSQANSRANSRSATPHSAKPELFKNYKSAAYIFSSDDESESSSKPEAGSKTSPKLESSTLDLGSNGKASQEVSEITSSDESGGTSSSSEESNSEDNESPDSPSASKLKRAENPARRSGTPDDKRMKMKREPSPTPSAVTFHESSSESESESESDSDDESTRSSNSKARAVKNRDSRSEPESGSESESQSGSADSESDVDQKVAVKSSPNQAKSRTVTATKKSGSPTDSTSSDSAATDSSESSDSEDEPQARGPMVKKEKEPVDGLTLKLENDASGTSKDSDSSSEESGSGSESESSSDPE
ncbi:hypothetical protein BDW75DRAFT_203526 [Aspergillus navahoensis]